MDLSGKKKKDDAAVQAVESEWRKGIYNIPEYRAHAEEPFDADQHELIEKRVGQLGERFVTEMVGTFLSKRERYLEPIMWLGSYDFPLIDFALAAADSLALEMFTRADISFEPRRIDIDWAHLNPVEETWRKNIFTAMGMQGNCCWVLDDRHKAAGAELIARYREGRAVTLVERVLRFWHRYRCIAPVRCDTPVLGVIAGHADTWIDLAEHYAGPPPYLKDSDAPILPVGACGVVEEVWREAMAQEFPAFAVQAEHEPWTERDQELLATVEVDCEDGTVLDAVRSFAPWWRRGQEMRSPLPSRDDFAKYCRWWCRSQSAPKGAAEGACRNDSSAGEHDDEWRTAAELAEQWSVPEQTIREVAERLGLHDDPRMARPARIA